MREDGEVEWITVEVPAVGDYLVSDGDVLPLGGPVDGSVRTCHCPEGEEDPAKCSFVTVGVARRRDPGGRSWGHVAREDFFTFRWAVPRRLPAIDREETTRDGD